MTRKVLIPCLAAILAVGVAVPVIAQTTTVAPRVSERLSKKALAKARTALRTARAAKRQVRLAEEAANDSAGAAAGARSAAAAAQASVDATRVATGLAAGAATTTSESFVALPGGPSVTVTVPASGLIEVWAQVSMDEAGAVSLYEDGKGMPGQSELCGREVEPGLLEPGLFNGEGFPPEAFESGPLTLTTPATPPFCASDGAPTPELFQTTPGPHTYELRYASCGCGEGGPGASPVTFSERRLYVAPRL